MKKLFISIFIFVNCCFAGGLENNYSVKGEIASYLKTSCNDNILLSTDKNFLTCGNDNKLINCDIRQLISGFDPFICERTNSQNKISYSLLFTNDAATSNSSKWAKVDKVKFSIATAALVGIGVYAHDMQMKSWWSHDRGDFNVKNDWEYACQLDKVGHGYAAMVITRTIAEIYSYTGVERGTSMLIGTVCGLGWQTYLEIMDGFGLTWGFSPSDFISDVLGAAYPVVQEYYKPLRNFNFKLSYYPTPFLTEGVIQDNGMGGNDLVKKANFTEDYAGQVYWLSVNIHEYLPKKIQRYWPEWLSIAVGYSLANWNGLLETLGHRVTDREIWLSFDYNLEKLPGDAEFLVLLKKIFNQFHLPAPAVRLTPSVIWYGLFYAHII